MSKLSAWTHPSTGETRIYVRDSEIGAGDKLFLTQAPAGSIGAYRATLKVLPGAEYAYRRHGGGKTMLVNAAETIAERVLSETGLRDAAWADLVAAGRA